MGADLAHWYSNDLTVAASGDLLTVTEPIRSEQRLVRRLLTPKGSYIWHPNYGGGLAELIGQPNGTRKAEGIIRAQLRLESAIASSPAPQVTVTSSTTGVSVATIVYFNKNTGSMRTLSFPIGQSLVA
jgi:phage baseplate assembly protein W